MEKEGGGAAKLAVVFNSLPTPYTYLPPIYKPILTGETPFAAEFI